MTAAPTAAPSPHPPPAWMATLGEAVTRLDLASSFPRHVGPAPDRASAAAVLMLYGPLAGGGEEVVLTERTPHLRSHAGQVSFPGGRLDPTDDGPVGAALREAREEIGLDAGGVRIVQQLPELFLAVSSSAVTPVLGWWEQPGPVAVCSPGEVARIVRVAIRDLLEPRNRFTWVHPNGYTGPGFDVDGLFVWGFTAALLAGTLDLAGLDDGDWDHARRRPVPAVDPRPAGVPHGGDDRGEVG